MAESHRTGKLAEHKNLLKYILERGKTAFSEVADGAKVGRLLGSQDPKGYILLKALGDLTSAVSIREEFWSPLQGDRAGSPSPHKPL